MKKSTFLGNLIAWLVVGAACGAFLAWYNLADADVVLEATELTAVQAAMVLSSPLLLFAIGVLLGLLLVRLRRALLRRGTRTVCRVVAGLVLAIVLLAVVPALVPSAPGAFLVPTMIVVVVTMVAPFAFSLAGIAYALGCAGVDPNRRGRIARDLPEDERE